MMLGHCCHCGTCGAFWYRVAQAATDPYAFTNLVAKRKTGNTWVTSVPALQDVDDYFTLTLTEIATDDWQLTSAYTSPTSLKTNRSTDMDPTSEPSPANACVEYSYEYSFGKNTGWGPDTDYPTPSDLQRLWRKFISYGIHVTFSGCTVSETTGTIPDRQKEEIILDSIGAARRAKSYIAGSGVTVWVMDIDYTHTITLIDTVPPTETFNDTGTVTATLQPITYDDTTDPDDPQFTVQWKATVNGNQLTFDLSGSATIGFDDSAETLSVYGGFGAEDTTTRPSVRTHTP